ncbi:MAG: twin-arginine translocation signal domain-containing protein, partial [Lachnospiraceae bacterium]|nr:twin-arginine translocation signal domain-containing protein [Lachnospiraceae bacterium]
MRKNISRRDFLKGTAAGALSVAAVGILGACGNDAATTTAAPETQGTTAAPVAPETSAPETSAPVAENTMTIAQTIECDA